MRTAIFALLIFFVPFLKAQQNLVPNPSFELNSSCPDYQDELFKCSNWYIGAETPDYYNTCSTTVPPLSADVPQNFTGWQQARTGNAYSGIGTGPLNDTSNNQREYIGCKLTDTLISEKKYYVEFYVSLADSSMWGMDRIGIYFSPNMIQDLSTFSYLPYQPQIESSIGSPMNDTANWVKISDTLFAVGGETYITIGNFHPTTQASLDTLPNGTWAWAYYYVEDILVTDCGWTGIHSPAYSTFSLFPNPSAGNFQLTGNFSDNAQLHIYNLIGQEVIESFELPIGNNSVPINIELAEGVYFYRIISDNEVLHSNKLMIVR